MCNVVVQAAHVNTVNISFPSTRNFNMRDKQTNQNPKHLKFNETFMSLGLNR